MIHVLKFKNFNDPELIFLRLDGERGSLPEVFAHLKSSFLFTLLFDFQKLFGLRTGQLLPKLEADLK